MKDGALIGAAGLLAVGAWMLYSRQQDQASTDSAGYADSTDTGSDWLASADSVLTDAGQSTAEFVDSITGGILKVSAMARVNPFDLNNPNVQAMLRVIRTGEGTAGPDGYRIIFGGRTFDSFADHPRVTVKSGAYTSSAAGAYQFIVSSWDETRRVMNLPDFSPRSQDLAALGRIAARGALEDVKGGRFDQAIKKLSREWASLPGSPYGQPTISWDRARNIFAMAGGEIYQA